MKNEIVKFDAPELQRIDESKAAKIKATFEPMAEMLTDFENAYNKVINESQQEITKDITAKAKRLRLAIGRVRIETGKLKDKQKEYIKLEDRAIMGVHNLLVYAVKEKEDKLKEIENHFEIQEKKRLEALQNQRAEKLSKYVEDAHERDLSGMDKDVWNAYFAAKKQEHEDRIAAEKKAEKERIERERKEAEERERIRKENERLKKEAQERERLAKIEAEKRRKAEAEQKAKAEAERKKREEKERKEREAHEAALRAEREKQAKLQAELEAKAEAERKRKAKKQADLNKDDAAKVRDLIYDLRELKTKYSFKSAKNRKMQHNVITLLEKVINYINEDRGSEK